MRRSLAAVAVAAVLGLVACGGADEPALDAACTESAAAVRRALDRAPAEVTLSTGTRLSECVSAARSDSDLQNAGVVLTGVAEELAVRARAGDERAAVALGYLVGATRRGAARTAGIHAELRRRIQRAAAFLDEGGAAVVAALERGRRAGEAAG